MVLVLAAMVLAGSVLSCEANPTDTDVSGVARGARVTTSSASTVGESKRVSRAEQQTIPTGAFQAGTQPGQLDRVPQLEPATFEVRLGEFRIDTRPYPNQLGQPPRYGVSREVANRLCKEAGGRLCTELEWERACKGPDSLPFASGQSWDCLDGTCSSGFGVQGLGNYPEWTSGVFGMDSPRAGKPVVRGAASGAPANHHRCARRDSADKLPSEQLTFRCCYGAPNAAPVIEPKRGKAFRGYELKPETLEQLLTQHPHTAELGESVSYFSSPEAINTVLARGPGDRKGFDFTVRPLLWQPVAGAKYLVVAARSGERTSFVVTFHVANDASNSDELRFSIASSFIMKNEPGPVVLAYSESIRPRLHFSGCWGCPGETGKVIHRAPERAVIVQP